MDRETVSRLYFSACERQEEGMCRDEQMGWSGRYEKTDLAVRFSS